MRNNDIVTREQARAAMQKAIKDNDQEAFALAFDQLLESIGEETRQTYEEQMNQLRQEMDTSILTNRGVRQLTSEERKYYQALAKVMQDKNPRQALENLDVVMPETIINSVFDDLETNHPLLSRINFVPSGGAITMLMNTNGYQEAAWGELCDEIVKELTSGFKEVSTTLLKLSAFIPVCKAMLELGPEWLDRYVRTILYEALANGLEVGIVDGDGNKKPIGMNRQVGDEVTVTGGVYPKKEAVKIYDLKPETIGAQIAKLSQSPNGSVRPVRDVILVVNPVDYFTTIMPATTLMAPDGTYRNDVLPYPMTVIQSPAVTAGQAILGMANRYFAAAGISKDGRIEFSDHVKFLEDQRVYLIKTYANGLPMDNNAFILLDISDLAPLSYRVETVSPAATVETSEETV